MKRRYSRFAIALLTVTAGLLSGCSSAPATVSGEVTYNGEPVADGYVTFTPSDGKGADAGAKITDGRYAVASLPPGPKIVKVIGVRKVSFASTSDEMRQKSAEARKSGNFDGLVAPADTIPDDAEGNNAAFTVAPGDNRCDLKLRKPPAKK